jgi:hypothetical protein
METIWDNYWFTLEALASCAIEGNALAIELLELKKTDPEKFMQRLHGEGWMKGDQNDY